MLNVRTVCKVGGDGERTLLVQAHSLETLIPTLDNLPNAD